MVGRSKLLLHFQIPSDSYLGYLKKFYKLHFFRILHKNLGYKRLKHGMLTDPCGDTTCLPQQSFSAVVYD